MNFTGINPEILDLMLGSGSQTTAPTTEQIQSEAEKILTFLKK